MRALVSSHCITCSRTHDSVDRATVIACTRQTHLNFPNRGTSPGRNTLVTRLIVRIVSVSPVSVAVSVRIISVRIIAVWVIPVRIAPVVKRIVKERIAKVAEEDEPITESAMVAKIAIPAKVPGHSGTETRAAPSETGPHSGESRTTAEAATSSTSATKPAPSTTTAPATMPSGHGDRGAQSDCCNAACEQN